MDEVESMWTEMAVFEIDLMISWIDRHGFDRQEVNGIILQVHDASK